MLLQTKLWTKLWTDAFAKKLRTKLQTDAFAKEQLKIAEQNYACLNFMEIIVSIYRGRTGLKIFNLTLLHFLFLTSSKNLNILELESFSCIFIFNEFEDSL